MKEPTRTEHAQATVALIRSRYPDPICAQNICDSDEEYCVGRSAWLYAGGGPVPKNVFTTGWDCFDIASALKKLNPGLSFNTAIGMANDISELNDRGHFDSAYKALEHALELGAEPWT